jgi:multisubunit Na+/H+ antiporter MnhG subunit
MNALHLIWIIPLVFAAGFICSSILGVSRINDLYDEITRLKGKKSDSGEEQ